MADGDRPATDVLNEAVALGIAERTLRRARNMLGVLVRRQGFKDGRFLLALPADGTHTLDGVNGTNGVNNGNGHDDHPLAVPNGFSVS